MFAHICVHIHTERHTHTHKHNTPISAHTCPHKHECTECTLTCSHKMYTHKHMNVHITHMHTYTHANAHTCKSIHTYKYMVKNIRKCLYLIGADGWTWKVGTSFLLLKLFLVFVIPFYRHNGPYKLYINFSYTFYILSV